MTITIRPEHERLIDAAIASGSYRDAAEVVGRALEVLRSEDEWLAEERLGIDRRIDRALSQFERGKFFSPEDSRSDMEKRKAAWMHVKHP